MKKEKKKAKAKKLSVFYKRFFQRHELNCKLYLGQRQRQAKKQNNKKLFLPLKVERDFLDDILRGQCGIDIIH